MLVAYVLFYAVLLSDTGPTTNFQQFSSEEACQAAAKAIVSKASKAERVLDAKAQCLIMRLDPKAKGEPA